MNRPEAGSFAYAYAQAFSSGDPLRVARHYAHDAVIVDAAGVQHRGIARIRDFLAPVLKRGGAMTVRPRVVIELIDLALVLNDFDVKIDGQTVLRSTSIEVLRFEREEWTLVFDLPYGTTTHEGS